MTDLRTRIGEHFRQRSALLPDRVAAFPNLTIEGFGSWAQTAYLPALQRDPAIPATFTYDSDYGDRPTLADPQFRLHDKARDSKHYPIFGFQSAIMVATPDIVHMPVASSYAGRVPLLIVEKPFTAEYRQIDELKEALIARGGTAVFGVDHYLLRLAALGHELPDVVSQIYEQAGRIESIRFRISEQSGLLESRLKTLQFGVGLDMLPHGFALLSALGPISTFDDLQIVARFRYIEAPAVFQSETGLEVEGSLQLLDGRRVPVSLFAAKGWCSSERTLLIKGARCDIRVDLTAGTIDSQSLDERIPPTVDAYRWLLEGVCHGLNSKHAWGLLTLLEAEAISHHLELMWRAARRVDYSMHQIGAGGCEK